MNNALIPKETGREERQRFPHCCNPRYTGDNRNKASTDSQIKSEFENIEE
jgi:hypothetical protein